MNLTHTCSECGQPNTVELVDGADRVVCPHCDHTVEIPPGAFSSGAVHRCLVCPSTDLYVRKDFPQQLGVAIVVVGFAVSCVTWYFYLTAATFSVLFATALIDVVLYLFVGNALMCYRCGATYRDVEGLDEHGGFDLETHERYRQESARLAETAAAGKG
ncbi:MAG: hypothetical protein R3C10_12625 [Pirellulales bacterium]|nr:hypothetical protein [Planctomycetales bacterium]